jgi:predicted nucleotidyltransferase
MVDPEISDRAVEALRQAAPKGSRIILFGSCATGTMRPDSDIDLLVLEPVVESRWKEMVRLRKAIGSIGVPVDILVIDEQRFDDWKNAPTAVYWEAATKGREYARVA